MKLHACTSCALVAIALSPLVCFGQTNVLWQGGGPNNNWTTGVNWDTGVLPTGAFDEIANIDNGATVIVNSNLAAIPSPDGPAGELNVTNDSKLDVIGSGAFVTDDSGPTVDGSASFSSGGILALTGGSTSFSSKGLSFANGGVYTPILTGSSHGLISVVGDLALAGGTLKPTVSFSPGGPQSWVLADASSISGNFVLDTSAAGLSLGRKLTTALVNGGVNGRQLRLDLKNVLALTVNADTGATSISSPTGTAITMTGYGVTSAGGQLNTAGWTTITSQVGGGWGVAGTATANHLDELGGPVPPGNTTQASISINATPRTLGTAFKSNLPFGVAPDLKFEYVTSAGDIVQGDLQFTGLNAVNNLLLTVDPSTGQARLTNSSKTTIKLRGYSILSDDGSLKPTNGNWNSLDDQNLTGVDEANASTTHLSELVPQIANAVTLTPGQFYNLGSIFTTSGTRDLELEFFYTGPGILPGDFNADGSVNGTDLSIWQAGYGTTYTGRDFLAWQRNVGSTSSGSGTPTIGTGVVKYQALSPLTGFTTVPEPASLQLALALGTLGLSVRGRRKNRATPNNSCHTENITL